MVKCPICGGETFVLESTIIVTEKYKIYKNGTLSYHPIKTNVDDSDRADNDNIVRCTDCNSGFVLPHKSRYDLLHKVNFSKIDLRKDAVKEASL